MSKIIPEDYRHSYERCTFLGATVININATIGWNDSPSRLTVSLVEDEDNNDQFNPPTIGTIAQFNYKTFFFDGIVNSINENNSFSGRKIYEVVLTDPRQFFDGIQIVLSDNYADINVPNIYNVFGYYERKSFGSSQSNNLGMPWNLIRSAIIEMVKEPTNTRTIQFRGVSYILDLSELPELSNYRVAGNSISLSALINEICEVSNHDYFVKMIGTQLKVKFISRNRPFDPNALNNLIELLSANYDVSSFSKGTQLEYNLTNKYLIGSPKEFLFYQYKQDFKSPQQKEEEEKTNIYPAEGYEDDTIVPFWGLNPDGSAKLGIFSGLKHRVVLNSEPFTYPQFNPYPNGYPVDVAEMLAALEGQPSWEAFLWSLNNATWRDADGNPVPVDFFNYTHNIHYKKAERLGIFSDIKKEQAQLLKAMGVDTWDKLPPIVQENFNRRQAFLASGDLVLYLQNLYQYILSYAEEYLGKKYMVRVPQVLSRYDSESDRVITSLIPIDSGYLEENEAANAKGKGLLPFYDAFLKDENGKYFSYIKYQRADFDRNFNLANIPVNDYYIENGNIFIKCTLDQDIVFLNRTNMTNPRVVINLPGKVTGHDMVINTGGVMFYISAFFMQPGEEKKFKDEMIKKLSSVGGDNLFQNMHQLPIDPDLAVIALQDTLNCYGPWFAGDGGGKTEYEQNSDLNPWTFGGYKNLNLAGQIMVNESVGSRVLGDTGYIEMAYYPIYNLGDELIASGPTATQVQVNFDFNGVTSRYEFGNWDFKGGKELRQTLDRLRNLTRLKNKRILDTRPNKPQILNTNIKLPGILKPARNKANTSAALICGQVYPDNEKLRNQVVTMPSYNLYSVYAEEDEKWNNKAGSSLDGVFRPYSTNPSDTHMPHFEEPETSSEPTCEDLNPLKEGHDIAVVFRGDSPPEKIISEYYDPDISDYEDQEDYQVEFGTAQEGGRGIALRGPIVITGWGYDTEGKPLPNDGEDNFVEDYLQKSHLWPCGPLDVRFDNKRKVWVANGAAGIPGIIQSYDNINKTYTWQRLGHSDGNWTKLAGAGEDDFFDKAIPHNGSEEVFSGYIGWFTPKDGYYYFDYRPGTMPGELTSSGLYITLRNDNKKLVSVGDEDHLSFSGIQYPSKGLFSYDPYYNVWHIVALPCTTMAGSCV